MLNFIKKYWFTSLVSLFVIFYLMVFVFVLVSPKVDKQSRGFIPCTQEMTVKILGNEEQSSLKLVKIVIDNTFCDIKVVTDGLVSWVKGKQSTPWANYFFEPEIEQETVQDDEELLKFYEENPYISEDMEKLDFERKKLEQLLSQDELEENSNVVVPFEFEDDENTEDIIEEKTDESNNQK